MRGKFGQRALREPRLDGLRCGRVGAHVPRAGWGGFGRPGEVLRQSPAQCADVRDDEGHPGAEPGASGLEGVREAGQAGQRLPSLSVEEREQSLRLGPQAARVPRRERHEVRPVRRSVRTLTGDALRDVLLPARHGPWTRWRRRS